jgi:hypothetical protein
MAHVSGRPRWFSLIALGILAAGGFRAATGDSRRSRCGPAHYFRRTFAGLGSAGNLFFHGSADGHFAAFSADKGEKLWEVQLAPGAATPITYELDGKGPLN